MRVAGRVVLAVAGLVAAGAAWPEDLPASPLLPQDHWAVKDADRLEELGLLDRWMPAQRAVPVLAVEAAFVEAEQRARERRPDLVALVTAWRQRFEAEWTGAQDQADPRPRLLGAQMALGYQDGSAQETGQGPPATGLSAVHLQAPGSDPFAEWGAAGAWGSHLAAGARVRATPDGAVLTSGEVVGAWSKLSLSLGRGAVGYGPNEVGGITASGNVPLDRIELMTSSPFRLPGWLEGAGDFTADVALASLDEARHPYHPLLLDFYLQWRPAPRLTFGLARGFMFGGTLWDGISLGNALLALPGLKNYAGNNVYSATVRYRLPTEAFLPLTAKMELGSDDNPGAAFTWPGFLLGVTAPMLPRVPVSLGVEYAFIGKLQLWGHHNPFFWYEHGQYQGGWASGQTPLGDPLGGEGRAVRLVARADPVPGVLRISGLGWLQERFAHNDYAPMAAGNSAGVSGEAEARLGRWALDASGTYEHGSDGWHRSAVELAVRLFY